MIHIFFRLYTPRLNKPSANDPVDDAINVHALKAVNAVANLVANTVGAVRAWHTRHAAIDALSQLDDYLLNDIGIHRGEIRAVVDGTLGRPRTRIDRSSLALHVAADRAQRAANDNDLASVA